MSDKVEAEKIAADRVQIRAELGLSNVNAIAEAGAAANRAEAAAERAHDDANKAIDANTKSQQAKTIATQQAATATNKATEAKASADKASAISGMDRVEDAVDLALMDKFMWSRNRATFDGMADEVKRTRSGSGWDEFGRHYAADASSVINEGMWATPLTPNQLVIGRRFSDGGGMSRTDEGGPTVDGVKIKLGSVADASSQANFKYPPAPDGTQVADTSGDVRGSGKPKLDLKVDKDPKYNDVAATVNEAVARAFEGAVKNGDFRKGTTDWIPYGAVTQTVSNGVITVAVNATGGGGSYQNIVATANKKLRLEVTGLEKVASTGQVIIYDGASFTDQLVRISPENGKNQTITVTPTKEAIRVYFYAGSNVGESVSLNSFSVAPVTESVILTRQDLSFLETWREVMGSGSGEKDIYCPNGLPQYGATSYLGIPLVDLSTTSIGLGYAKFGEWQDDADVISKVMVWSTLSLANKKKVVDNDPNMYYDESLDKPVCVRARGRVIEGLGSWGSNVMPQRSVAADFVYTSKVRVHCQGSSEVSLDFNELSTFWRDGFSNAISTSTDVTNDNNIWQSRNDYTSIPSIENKCFALPLALTQRLNNGGYHPSYNPWGCNSWLNAANDPSGGPYWKWWQSESHKPNSKMDCFDYGLAGSGHKVYEKGGVIGSFTGRTDSLEFSDAIYATEVEDKRLPSTKQEADRLSEDTMRLNVDGSYRGKGRVPFMTACRFEAHPTNPTVGNLARVSNGERILGSELAHPEKLPILTSSTNAVNARSVGLAATNDSLKVFIYQSDGNILTNGTSDGNVDGDIVYLPLISDSTPEFNILPYVNIACAADDLATIFPDGCIGEWIPEDLVNGNVLNLTRKAIGNGKQVYTTDRGQNWTESALTINSDNEVTSLAAGSLSLIYFDSPADVTEKINNPTVYAKSDKAFVTCSSDISKGNRLAASLSGVIGKSTQVDSHGTVALLKCTETNGKLSEVSGEYPVNSPIDLTEPNSGDKAVKTLYGLVDEDGLLYPAFWGCSVVWEVFTSSATITAGSPSQQINKGSIFSVSGFSNGEVSGLLRAVRDIPAGTWAANKFDGYYQSDNGFITDSDTIAPFVSSPSGRWVDDATPIVSGEVLKTDSEGNAILAFCHRGLNPVAIADYTQSAVPRVK